MILIVTYENVTGSFIRMHGNSEARTKKGMDVRVKRGHHPYFCTFLVATIQCSIIDACSPTQLFSNKEQRCYAKKSRTP